MLQWTWSKKGETLEKSKKKEVISDEKSKERKKVDKRKIKLIYTIGLLYKSNVQRRKTKFKGRRAYYY